MLNILASLNPPVIATVSNIRSLAYMHIPPRAAAHLSQRLARALLPLLLLSHHSTIPTFPSPSMTQGTHRWGRRLHKERLPPMRTLSQKVSHLCEGPMIRTLQFPEGRSRSVQRLNLSWRHSKAPTVAGLGAQGTLAIVAALQGSTASPTLRLHSRPQRFWVNRCV